MAKLTLDNLFKEIEDHLEKHPFGCVCKECMKAKENPTDEELCRFLLQSYNNHFGHPPARMRKLQLISLVIDLQPHEKRILKSQLIRDTFKWKEPRNG